MPTGYSNPTVTARQAAQLGGQGRIVAPAAVVVDKQSRPYTASEQDGQAAIYVPAPGQGNAMQVEIIDLWSNSAQAPVASVYIDSAAPQNEVDYSSNAGHDIAYENPAIYVPAGSSLLIVWSGLSTGARCTARVQYSVLEFLPVAYG